MPFADRPPLPPFLLETAIEKVRLAEDAWNSRDAERVSLAYTANSGGEIAPNSSTAALRS
jgi:uncharacterized protein